jgi:hypothetical protein
MERKLRLVPAFSWRFGAAIAPADFRDNREVAG